MSSFSRNTCMAVFVSFAIAVLSLSSMMSAPVTNHPEYVTKFSISSEYRHIGQNAFFKVLLDRARIADTEIPRKVTLFKEILNSTGSLSDPKPHKARGYCEELLAEIDMIVTKKFGREKADRLMQSCKEDLAVVHKKHEKFDAKNSKG